MTALAAYTAPVAPPGGRPADGAIAIKVDAGEFVVTARPDHVLVTVLGSCVAACLRDPVAAIGGMNHFMLPSSERGQWAGVSASMRYGNFAMEKLINEILKRGGLRRRLEAKLFGGATMVGDASIGPGNADFVEDYLREERIAVVARDLRGRHARQVRYAPVSGQAFVCALPRQDRSVWYRETQYVRPLDISGTVEVFD
jgi:chemotaxis protein CheD